MVALCVLAAVLGVGRRDAVAVGACGAMAAREVVVVVVVVVVVDVDDVDVVICVVVFVDVVVVAVDEEIVDFPTTRVVLGTRRGAGMAPSHA